MGYVMCLRGCSRYFWLIFIFPFFANATNYGPKIWASVGYWYLSSDYSGNQDKTTDRVLSTCNLSLKADGKAGDDNKPYDQKINFFYDYGLVVEFGKKMHKQPFAGVDSVFVYAEKFSFDSKLKDVYKRVLINSLKKALKNDNCDIANAILDAMQNPNIVKDGDKEFLGFKNGQDKCVVTSDGKTLCKGPSFKTGKGKDGETRLDIDPSGDWEKSLDDYASTKPSDNINNPGSSDNKNKGDGSGVDERRGSGSSNGTGQANNGNNKHGDKGADKNDGKPGNGGNGGSSIGNGKGEGEGDDEGKDIGDVKMPKLDTPDLEKIFNDAKNQIEDKVGSGYELSGGQCEPITIPVFNKIQTINVHCQILGKLDSTAGPVFTLLWTTLGVLIILSA